MAITPSWTEVIKTHIQSAVLNLHTAMPGRVESYDASTQQADVKPLTRWSAFIPGRQLKKLVDLPVLPDVLVCHPRAGNKGLHLPLVAGDLVLLVFCSRPIERWRAGSATKEYDPGLHEPAPFSGALALPMLTHDDTAWSGDMVSGSELVLGESGSPADFVALAQKVLAELQNIKTTFDSHTHPYVDSPAGPAVTSPTTSPLPAPQPVAATHVKVT